MGNNPPSATSLRLGNGDYSYDVQLGESASIHFRRREVHQQANGEITESWRLSYKVDYSTCTFCLSKTKGHTKSPTHRNDKLDITVLQEYEKSPDEDKALLGIIFPLASVQRAEAGLLDPTSLADPNRTTTTTANAWGGITETSVFFIKYGSSSHITVWEWKKKSKDEKPYMGTVRHFYAYKRNGTDVGLSVAVKRIRVSDDGHLDFAVDGPEEHPVDALFHVYDEVARTRIWKPEYCYHCAKNIIQRQRGKFWQSESEDSDIDYVPAALRHGRRQTSGGIVANDGRFRGNYNGNLSIRNLILGLRGR